MTAADLPLCGQAWTLPDGRAGEVVYKRATGQATVLGVRLEGGRVVTATVTPMADSTHQVRVNEADLAAADDLAEMVVAGIDVRLPVSTRVRLLAMGLLARRGGAA